VPHNIGLSAEEILAVGSDQAVRLKQQLAQRGWVSFDDAMYLALRVLREHPPIARAVAARYDEILVDEAQDTSELQVACLRALLDTGAVNSLVLIGDLEQSISSYTGASPAACEDLAGSHGLQRLELTENHRSSQKICDVAAHFCVRPSPDTAIGPDAVHSVAPELLLYPAREPRAAIELFHKRLIELDENPQHAAVLARKNRICDELNRGRLLCRIDKRPLAVGRAVAALRQSSTLGRHDIEQIDRIVALAAFGNEELSTMSPDQRDSLRSASIALLSSAPDLNLDLRTWIKATAARLTTVATTCTPSPARTGGQVLKSAKAQSDHQAVNVFHPNRGPLRAQTVHDIKGETRDTVLIVLECGHKRRPSQAAVWAEQLRTGRVASEHAEEIRIAFVALTRARRYCAVAVPDDTSEEDITAFETIGIKHLP
jgi:superfamily I DNA/RNA helicase